MQEVMRINGIINGIVWGPWMLALLVGTGVYLTIVLGVPQLRYFGLMFKEVFGNLGKKKEGEGAISSFAALSTALASTVGTGNIAGVATALHLGGPGALFWMLVSAVFGMTTKMAEVTLAVRFREKDELGNWRGGTMYILDKAAGQKWLAWLFALFGFLASFGIGCAVQANSTAEGFNLGFGIPNIYTGVAVAVLTALVIIGGLKRISEVTTYLVPFMAIFYIVGAILVVATHTEQIVPAFSNAVKYAFSDPMAMPGAIAGWAVKAAITRGIARGVFSNEAGLGSAPMVHATAVVDHPVRQGMYGLFEVFTDTIVICTLTALAILTSGVLTGQPELSGAKLSLSAFEAVLGGTGTMILSVGLALFAFSTILGWYWYSETCGTYIFGTKVIPVLKILWIAFIVLGAAGGVFLGDGKAFLDNLWDMADTLNGLMAIPNLVALLILSGELRKLVKDFDEKRRNGTLKI
ncbi:AGCS family alanine or glycine:cation symporter [Aminivibrio pyruvatiphilus]|uniref:AGCS family alanine or glycine:cation symporter n=1 Tax=Aminivibrio pyruvatiphilus TaxID=1005740 RepID=A0A4R8MLB5_9BACT|nr:sodium:alanine symporter family protein [Aminivibrio pyruvatiphilus]TDY65222.1 AGCS family alanine or glycine:cation symporter [Aminivibrio pyruvatiphilus]